MSEIAIRVEGLGKRYRIGANQEAYRTLREKLNNTAMAPFRAAKHLLIRNGNGNSHSANGNSKSQTFWALKDVSFDVKRGEVVGIIGRNGAGKSTLLKILSRITEPTEGHADINGRIASLLEVGTGFHPELTGRENVYLNGSILGMRRAEINRKFDEIVAFAEIDKFIDTPVKRFSSGMYVRLAFAVAAFMEQEILLVDEVLAVGDIGFQEKCLGKIGDVAKQGRTVLFVSHNLGAIQRLCSHAFLLNHGSLISSGSPPETVQKFMSLMQRTEKSANAMMVNQLSLEVRTLRADGNPTILWPYGEKLTIEVLVSTPEVLRKPSVDVGFYTGSRVRLFGLRSDRLDIVPDEIVGSWRVRFEIENPGLTAPEMVFDVGIREGAGSYRKLIMNAGSLSADHETFPATADSDCVLFANTSVCWEQSSDVPALEAR